ncbi:hypothetical protein EV1_003875 [Malus domestica]
MSAICFDSNAHEKDARSNTWSGNLHSRDGGIESEEHCQRPLRYLPTHAVIDIIVPCILRCSFSEFVKYVLLSTCYCIDLQFDVVVCSNISCDPSIW